MTTRTLHHLEGKLIEAFDQEWYLTDAGLECPDRSHLLAAPHLWRTKDPGLRASTERGKWARPDAPDFVARETWEILTDLAAETLEPRHF